MRKMYYIPEAIGTICWLLMDFFWLSKNYDVASIFCLGAISSLGVAASNVFFDEKCKASERINFITPFTWCLMNSFWFASDIPFDNPESNIEYSCLLTSKILFIISSILVVLSIFLSIKEKKELNFRRINIAIPEEEVFKNKLDV